MEVIIAQQESPQIKASILISIGQEIMMHVLSSSSDYLVLSVSYIVVTSYFYICSRVRISMVVLTIVNS